MLARLVQQANQHGVRVGERYAGRYELADQLGSGASGTVWRAWDHRTGRFVAAKLLRQRDAGDLLRFVREQSLRIRHPHVLPPIGWAAEDDDVLLTMDLVAGGSVVTVLRDYDHVPAAWAVVLLDQLLDALNEVHGAGVVHRDIKPANLLLEPTGTGPPHVRLGDFGIATVLDEPRLTSIGVVLGTPGYLAPEALLGAEPDPAQDLFSVGMVGRELLTGCRPRTGGDPVTRPESAPEPLWAWLSRLCADDPAERYSDASRARAELARITARCGLDREDAARVEEETVEVFDQLAQLPAGWTVQGPIGTSSAPQSVGATGPAADSAYEAGPADRTIGASPDEDAATAWATSDTASTPRFATGLAPSAQPAESRTALPGTAPSGPTRPDSEPATADTSPAGTHRRTALRLAAAAGLVVVAIIAFAAAIHSARSTPSPTATPSTGTASSDASGSPAPAAGDERAGASCDFTEVGQRRTTGGSVITCRQGGSGYQWTRLSS